MLQAAEPEPIDSPFRITAPHEWLILSILLASLLVAAIWGSFGRIDLKIVVDGSVLLPGQRLPVTATAAGPVQDVLVSQGEAVEKATPIAVIGTLDAVVRQRDSVATGEQLVEPDSGDSVAEAGESQVAVMRNQAAGSDTNTSNSAGNTLVSPAGGFVAGLYVLPGEFLEAGDLVAEIRSASEDPAIAVALLDRSLAGRVQTGMDAVAHCVDQSGSEQSFEAAVASVFGPYDTAAWLRANRRGLNMDAGENWMVHVALDGQEDLPLREHALCRIEIATGRVPPLLLIFSSQA